MDLMPEASSAPQAAKRRYVWRSLTAGLLFLPFYLGSQIAEDAGTSRLVVLVMGYAGMLALLWLIYEFVHLMRQLDELQQRIHITALACGFGAVALLISIGGMTLELWNISVLRDGVLGLFGTMAMPLGIIAYYVALHLVKRRYE
ncbi:hypothetical protein V0U79_03605 [Hyphobacterium sp. HN65]|uniref:Uncharacterized protein n=1 Tax=Hyphobacterium lacteum TaxID=3116575 RepID=A0ABU7LNE6_9PROT|nr:hypothetical protein [Hyphobacterium sp. HN65]MEE2525440.1 hypothetical protein [Hyphobacterium sp. HN65]